MPTSLSAKRNRILIALSLALFVLVSLTQIFTADKAVDNRQKFSTLSSKQITQITIDGRNKPKMAFEKLDNGWHLIEPFKRRADNSRIQVLLATLSLPKPHIYNSKDVDSKSLGLEPPVATLILNDSAFFFGNKGSNKDKRYLQTADKVTLAADIIYPLFSQGIYGFVEKTLVPPGFVHLESSNYSLTKSGNLWQSSNGSTEDAERIVAAWLGQLSQDILAWPLATPTQLQDANKHLIKFEMEQGVTLHMEAFEMKDVSLLHPEGAGYALVITADQFKTLGVSSN